jgi:hypothetical protein
MQKSESIKSIGAALLAFQIKADKIGKDAINPFFKSKYASLSHILDAISIPLAEAGLSYSQFPSNENGLTTILMHPESGEWMMAEYTMRPVKDDPQGRGSSITYQRRYAITAILGLNIDEDDDGNAASTPAPKSIAKDQMEKPWLNDNTTEFEGAVKKLKAGTTTIEKIKSVMKVSKATETKLMHLSKK